MRFEFCGNLSCPEWFIAEISVLTKIVPAYPYRQQLR